MRGAFLIMVVLSLGIGAVLTKKRTETVPTTELDAMNLVPGEAPPKDIQQLPKHLEKQLKALGDRQAQFRQHEVGPD